MDGLGNQMFQYAFGRNLQIQHGYELKFDITNGFTNDHRYHRSFSLGEYNTKITPALSSEIPVGMNHCNFWPIRMFWKKIPRYFRKVVYETKTHQYDPAILCNKPGMYYIGHWQNEEYFSKIETTIRNDFTSKKPFADQIKDVINQMHANRSVSIHVRRYGFLDPNYGSCSLDFYAAALARIGITADTTCYIFSDDVEWVKSNLKLGCPCIYVADRCTGSAAVELLMMSHCQHHIISNSTFSWWGAWLGGNPQKIVVGPKVWLRELAESSRIYPKSWLRI
jgi:hypothetical protein